MTSHRPLDAVAWDAPILERTASLVREVAQVGFGWPDAEAVLVKVREELGEFEAASREGSRAAMEDELGDLLFAVLCLAAQVDADAEGCLDGTLRKFARRFEHVQRRALEDHGAWEAVPEGALEEAWQEAKRLEAAGTLRERTALAGDAGTE